MTATAAEEEGIDDDADMAHDNDREMKEDEDETAGLSPHGRLWHTSAAAGVIIAAAAA